MSESTKLLTITLGLPGCGKTTWTHEQVRSRPPGVIVRLNRDSLRFMLHGGLHLDPTPGGSGLNEKTERQVSAVERIAVGLLFATGAEHVIIDDTNMSPLARNTWYATAHELDATFGMKSFLDVPVVTCIERDLARGGPTVGQQVIRAMHERYGSEARAWYGLVCDGYDPPDFRAYEKKG